MGPGHYKTDAMKTQHTKPKDESKLIFTVRPAVDIAEQLKVKIASDKTINFSKEKAFQYLELDTFQGERSVNERHVQFLYNAWVGGRFMWDHVIIACCILGDKKYRVNGQHTCWMRVNLDEDYFIKKGEGPRVREVVYQVESEDQLRALYSTFDQNKQRTPSHVFRALLSGTMQAQDLWPSSLNRLGAGLKHWLYESKDRWMLSSNDVAQLVTDKYEDLFKIVGLFVQSHDQDGVWLKRAGVIAAMFATFEKAGGKAPEFWDPVATGLHLEDKTDPRYALREYLSTHKQSIKDTSARVARNLTNAEDTYRICILVWNKWRKGEKVRGGLRSTDKRYKAI